MNNIEKTLKYLIETFENSEYYQEHLDAKNYRIEHSIRVANISKQIARKEDLNEEALVIACLLHDIGYACVNDDYNEHGRISASIARKFLSTLALPNEVIEDICYGIAIHVDGVANFEGKDTIFANTVSDCDNIDRFDVYRIYEGLQYQKFDQRLLDDKINFLDKKIETLNKYKDSKMVTITATIMWKEKILFQLNFFETLKNQIENSKEV